MFEPEWDYDDYVYDKRASVEKEVAALEAQAIAARAEADHARRTPGLLGPAENTEQAAKRLDAEVADVREIAARVEAGYPYWERQASKARWTPMASRGSGSRSQRSSRKS